MQTVNNQKTSKRDTGFSGETLACDYLEKHGLQPITKNYLCRQGEIDLVMQDEQQNSLVFVEVRQRKNTNFGSPAETVTPAKQQKIINAAQHFIVNNKVSPNIAIRFDIVGILSKPNCNPEIDWIPNAFYAY